MRIALISCSKEKKNYPCPAHELYSASNLFSLSYKYAKKYADKIYILSAKYGLVAEECILKPYNQTLNEMGRQQQLSWANSVLRALQKECDIESDSFILLAGNTYCRDLVPHLPNHSLPLAGLRMGERMAYLKKLLNDSTEHIPKQCVTANDERVCPICSPRDNQVITDGIYPPAHPRCRCVVGYELS